MKFQNWMEGSLKITYQAHHDHPGDPEEEDIMASFQNVVGVEGLEVDSVVWPRHGGEGEQPRTEPRVQHIFVTDQGDFCGTGVIMNI